MRGCSRSLGTPTGQLQVRNLASSVFSHLAVFTILWPVILTITGGLVVVRWFVNLVLVRRSNGKVTLMSVDDTWMAIENRPNLYFTIASTVLVRWNPGFREQDLERLRTRVKEAVFGNSGYRKLLCAPVVTWGFLCWEDLSQIFDVKEHVRLAPQVRWGDSTISKSDLETMTTTIMESPWESGKPRWEILVVPKVGCGDATCVAIVLRMSHGYMDGVSGTLFFQRLFSDRNLPEQMSLIELNEEVKQPEQVKSRWQVLRDDCKLLLFDLGNLFLNNIPHVGPTMDFFGNVSSSFKCFQRTLKIKLGALAQVRKSLQCSTEEVLVTTLTRAMLQVAKEKGREVPPTLLFAATRVMLPYSDFELQNRYSFTFHRIPTTSQSTKKMLVEVVKALRRQDELKCEDEARLVFYCKKFIGLFPATFLRNKTPRLLPRVPLTTIVTWVEDSRFMGHEVEAILPHAPSNFQTVVLTVLPCSEFLAVGLQAKESALIPSPEALEDMCQEFELEFHNLVAASAHLHSLQ